MPWVRVTRRGRLHVVPVPQQVLPRQHVGLLFPGRRKADGQPGSGATPPHGSLHDKHRGWVCVMRGGRGYPPCRASKPQQVHATPAESGGHLAGPPRCLRGFHGGRRAAWLAGGMSLPEEAGCSLQFQEQTGVSQRGQLEQCPPRGRHRAGGEWEMEDQAAHSSWKGCCF